MKKALLLLPILALAIVPFTLKEPVAVYAEGEEVSEVISEQVSEEQTESQEEVESTSKFDINQVVIDGKTVEQWKKELKDEQTRNSVIMAAVITILPSLLVVIRWITERKFQGKFRTIMSDGVVQLAEIKKERDEFKKEAEESKKELERRNNEVKEMTTKTINVLEIVMKTDPSMVAAEAYKQAKAQLEGRHEKE